MWKAVILIGGPGKGTRFRPLSLGIAKPLFPVAGLPMVRHHIETCSMVPEIREVLLIGFYPIEELKVFVEAMKKEYDLNIRYLMEFTSLGTAGGIYHFRDQIRLGNPEGFFVINSDVCCNFPLKDIINFHVDQTSDGITLVATHSSDEESLNYGCVVEKQFSGEVAHYVEKPETFVSSLINSGLYVFSVSILKDLGAIVEEHSFANDGSVTSEPVESISLEKEIIKPLAGSGKLFVYKISEEWTQIKSAASAIHANKLLLSVYRSSHLNRLVQNKPDGPVIRGDVFIHKSAKVDPSAVLGPNVSVSENVVIGQGVRVSNSIVLSGSVLEDNCCVLNSIIGWESSVGCWARIDGTSHFPNPNVKNAKMVSDGLFTSDGRLVPSITVLGRQVKIDPEIVILNSIILPNKKLTASSKNQILL